MTLITIYYIKEEVKKNILKSYAIITLSKLCFVGV